MNMGSDRENNLRRAFHRHQQKYSEDFPYFAQTELLIDTKSGGTPVPFVLNKAQEYVWLKLKEQWENTGMIRANILKGRQQGMSTLVAAIIFWQAVTRPCVNSTLVSKDFKATKSLFDKIKRFAYERMIDKTITVDTCNLDEIRFSSSRSLIRMSSAKSEQSSRGSTNTSLFLSEAPYWENGIEQVSALFDSVARLPGTIIIMESTARGKDPLFYENFQMGERDDSDWQSIFVPWYWQDEYRIGLRPHEIFDISLSEQQLMDQYSLDIEQIKWRRNKLMEYRRADPLTEFKREYPCCPEDAFESATISAFFDIERVRISQSNMLFDCSGDPLYIGVDVGAGGDPSVACFRQGINVLSFDEFTSECINDTKHWIEKIVRTHRPARVYVDSGGIGLGLSQDLSMMYGGVCRGVNFGERPDDIEHYANKRAEMFDRLRAYFLSGPVSLCKNDDLITEMQVVKPNPEKAKLTIENKDTIRKLIGRSTNYLDAVALTFAEDTQFGMRPSTDDEPVVFMTRPEPMMYNITNNV